MGSSNKSPGKIIRVPKGTSIYIQGKHYKGGAEIPEKHHKFVPEGFGKRSGGGTSA